MRAEDQGRRHAPNMVVAPFRTMRTVADRELWACATLVLERHGEAADAFVAERVRTLAVAGDEKGVRTWMAIARRLDALRAAPVSRRMAH